VYVLVLENDGSALAAAITCAGLALADASVPMYDLVAAATLVRIQLYIGDLSVPMSHLTGTHKAVCAHIEAHFVNDSLYTVIGNKTIQTLNTARYLIFVQIHKYVR
jgi:hypothetical protein